MLPASDMSCQPGWQAGKKGGNRSGRQELEQDAIAAEPRNFFCLRRLSLAIRRTNRWKEGKKEGRLEMDSSDLFSLGAEKRRRQILWDRSYA